MAGHEQIVVIDVGSSLVWNLKTATTGSAIVHQYLENGEVKWWMSQVLVGLLGRSEQVSCWFTLLMVCMMVQSEIARVCDILQFFCAQHFEWSVPNWNIDVPYYKKYSNTPPADIIINNGHKHLICTSLTAYHYMGKSPQLCWGCSKRVGTWWKMVDRNPQRDKNGPTDVFRAKIGPLYYCEGSK